MEENKPVLELKSTKEKVNQKLKWKKNICQCALIDMHLFFFFLDLNGLVVKLYFMTKPSYNHFVVMCVEILSKELALLKHLVKLRRSCQQMILPDIRKCSKSDQIMGANRY